MPAFCRSVVVLVEQSRRTLLEKSGIMYQTHHAPRLGLGAFDT
jgi:hypothetical protein